MSSSETLFTTGGALCCWRSSLNCAVIFTAADTWTVEPSISIVFEYDKTTVIQSHLVRRYGYQVKCRSHVILPAKLIWSYVLCKLWQAAAIVLSLVITISTSRLDAFTTQRPQVASAASFVSS